MSEPERVFALLVEANPVPDPAALPDRLTDVEPHLSVADPGRTTMHTHPTTETPTPTPPPRRTWIAVLVAAVIVLAVGVVGALLVANDSTQPAVTEPPATTAPPATTVPPEPEAAEQARIDNAIAKVEAYFTAINAGNVDSVVALISPDGSSAEDPLAEADRNMYEANAVFTASYPWEVQGCEAVGTLEDRVLIDCAMVNSDPVWIALGVSEVIAPWWAFDDGHMDWAPFKGGDFSEANCAYVEYLRLNHLEAYTNVCDPTGYPLGSVNHDRGFALTADCAALASPLAEEIADWVEAGKPG